MRSDFLQVFTVYCATHIPTGLRYVGCTGQDLWYRIAQHINQPIDKRCKFQKFLHTTNPSDWKWEVLFTLPHEKEAFALELHYIKMWDLCQELNSSGGPIGWKHEKQFKKGHEPWNKGKEEVYSEDTLDKMRWSAIKRGNPYERTSEYKERAAAAQKGSRPIKCNETGEIFNSISAAARACNTTPGDIRRVLKGERSKTKGFTFSLVNKNEDV